MKGYHLEAVVKDVMGYASLCDVVRFGIVGDLGTLHFAGHTEVRDGHLCSIAFTYGGDMKKDELEVYIEGHMDTEGKPFDYIRLSEMTPLQARVSKEMGRKGAENSLKQ